MSTLLNRTIRSMYLVDYDHFIRRRNYRDGTAIINARKRDYRGVHNNFERLDVLWCLRW